MLAEIDKRLALLEQAQTLNTRQSDASFKALDSKLDSIAAKVEASAATSVASHAEAAATPAGRQLSNAIADERKRNDAQDLDIEALEKFRDEFEGSLKSMRALVVIFGAITAVLAIITFIANLPWHEIVLN